MFLLDVKPSTRKDKKLVATFCLCKEKNACRGTNHKVVHFGQKGSETFTEGASEEKKKAYLARHGKSPGEDWSDPTTPGALSRWLLWSQRSLGKAVESFKKKFKL